MKWISDKATVWTGLDFIFIKLFLRITGRAAATHGLFCLPTRNTEQATRPSIKMIKESFAKTRKSLWSNTVCAVSPLFTVSVLSHL